MNNNLDNNVNMNNNMNSNNINNNDGNTYSSENTNINSQLNNNEVDKSIAQEVVNNEQSNMVNNSANINNANVNTEPVKEKPRKRSISPVLALLLILICIGGFFGYYFLYYKGTAGNGTNREINNDNKKSNYRITSNSLENFDLYFLQLENNSKNMVYSPLSIKYALEMLVEGANGETKTQISDIIGDYEAKKYVNSENMSFANAMFIRNTFKDSVKQEYTDTLLNKYNAEVILDDFTSANNINSWVSNKTLKLIDNLVSDDDVKSLDYALINALAIDMEWQQKFVRDNNGHSSYPHEKKKDSNETFNWYAPSDVKKSTFKNIDNNISGMDIMAEINNYDIISEIGEESIRKTVEEAYRKYIKDMQDNNPDEKFWSYYDNQLSKKYGELTEDEINSIIKTYLDKYIEEIKGNYKKNSFNTEFSLYVDDDVKVFAKNLKEYNGTTLQYVGIMPINVELNNYIDSINAESLNSILSNLKELKSENFKEGIVTEIKGFIPKFKYEYNLDLISDLNKLGITDVFDSNKSDLSNLSSSGGYIPQAKHKANIEFTEDGIKAAAVTMAGGLGSGMSFDYFYEIPYEEIDLTFDKPYMYIIRDKNTGEIWFVGSVYEPLSWELELSKNY